jgi:signal transduction histidine kinase
LCCCSLFFLRWRARSIMSPDERLGRRIIGSFVLGLGVAVANFALDRVFARMGAARDTNVLNDLIIGAAAAVLAYAWVSRQDVKHALELSREKLMQEAIHAERKRMALELHDTVCQAHAGSIMHLELADDFLGDNPAARTHVHRALQLVRGSMTEMRCALWDLYPEELERLDLKKAIELLVKDLTADNGLSVQFSLDGEVRRLPLDIEKGLLRISQEALSNIVKHARAREVHIDLFLDFERARLSVKDDGQGFQPDLNAGSFGLTSMQDRTKAMGGIWTIHSEPGCGTEVHASIPIPRVAG